MLKFFKLVIVFSLLTLGACTASIRTDVVSFHKLEKPRGETFHIVPKAEGVEAGIEFGTYAEMISKELVALGYRKATGSNSDLLVKIDYGVSDGKEKIKTLPAMGGRFYGDWGFSFGFGHGIYWPGYHLSRDEIYAYTQYTRRLEMDIVQLNTDEILFEGRVISPGKDKRLPEGMPYLVEALFSSFPGESGKTRKVVISPEKN